MVLLWSVTGLVAFVATYVTVLRPWMRTKTWAEGYFRLIEPVELSLWKKSESILWARFQQLLGLVLTMTGFLGGIDYAMFTPFVPEKYHAALPMVPMIISALGFVAEALRRDTSQPLSVTALPTEMPQEVAAAVAKAEIAKEVAVEVVAEAKAEGKVA